MGKKYTIDMIKEEFEERGYELLSTEYLGCEDKLEYICNKHINKGVQKIDYNHFKNRGQGCKYCALENNGIKKRTDENILKNITYIKGFIYVGYSCNNSKTLIKYKCTNHLNKGIQTMTLTDMKKSTGKCSYCYGYHKTSKDFINEMNYKNPNIEILGEYVNSKTKIKCRCLIDGFCWETIPSLLLSGAGCPKCGIEKSKINSKKTHEKFVGEMLLINPNIEISSTYTNVKEEILCICKVCNNKWSTTPDSLLNGSGCMDCHLQKSHNLQVKSNELFLRELKSINPNIIPLETYYNDHTKLKCRCLIHNYEWYAMPNKILHRNTGCPKCASYTNENKIDLLLENWGIKYSIQKRFKECRDKNTLPFDRYLVNFNILIEYDGEDHYFPIKRCHESDEEVLVRFNDRIKKDKIKTVYCKKNDIPLIRIPYWEKDNIESFLWDELVKYGAIEETTITIAS